MPFVSITRLRIRLLRFMPLFLLHTMRAGRQIKGADGFLGGSLLAGRKRTYRTMTGWRDEGAMRAYMTSGAHLITDGVESCPVASASLAIGLRAHLDETTTLSPGERLLMRELLDRIAG